MDWRSVDEGLIRRDELLLSLDFLEGYGLELNILNNGRVGRPFKLTESYIMLGLQSSNFPSRNDSSNSPGLGSLLSGIFIRFSTCLLKSSSTSLTSILFLTGLRTIPSLTSTTTSSPSSIPIASRRDFGRIIYPFLPTLNLRVKPSTPIAKN
jgi:hypothetical protein